MIMIRKRTSGLVIFFIIVKGICHSHVNKPGFKVPYDFKTGYLIILFVFQVLALIAVVQLKNKRLQLIY